MSHTALEVIWLVRAYLGDREWGLPSIRKLTTARPPVAHSTVAPAGSITVLKDMSDNGRKRRTLDQVFEEPRQSVHPRAYIWTEVKRSCLILFPVLRTGGNFQSMQRSIPTWIEIPG